MSNQQSDVKLKIGVKSFITVVALLLVVLIFVGVMTFVIPSGSYETYPEGHPNAGQIIPDSFVTDEAEDRLPVWRWFTAPFESIIWGGSTTDPVTGEVKQTGAFNSNEVLIIALLLILGGTFMVLERSGGLVSLVRVLIERLYKNRYLAIWIITFVLMILSAVFGLQEQFLILYPILYLFATAMNWSNFTAISFILITSGVGFTTALTNPFTIGAAVIAAQDVQGLEGLTVVDGLWYRAIIFVVMFVVTSMFLVWMAKNDEKRSNKPVDLSKFAFTSDEQRAVDRKNALYVTLLFAIALGGVIIAMAIPALRDLAMAIMAVCFVVGTVIIGRKLLGSFKEMFKAFFSGLKDVAPSIIIILVAFAITYIAKKGEIIDYIFYKFYSLVLGSSPYVGVILLYVFVLILEFFIPSASAKAGLIIPMLTGAAIPGLSVNTIILSYLFADGYANVLFPTCGTLLIGLGLADVSYAHWFKRTILFQVILMAMSLGFLMLAVAMGY